MERQNDRWFWICLKIPKNNNKWEKIHKGADVSKDLLVFFNNIEPLVNKTLLLLIQLPYSLTRNKYFNSLKNMVNKLDDRFKYAIEFRDSSWFNDKVYDFLEDTKMILSWSIIDKTKTSSVLTTDQIYIRLIEGRSINDKDFGKIVKDRKKEMV